MSPYTKVAAAVIRLIGLGCMAVALALMAGDLFLVLAKHVQGRTLFLGLEIALFCIGLGFLWKSSTLARRIMQDFDDE